MTLRPSPAARRVQPRPAVRRGGRGRRRRDPPRQRRAGQRHAERAAGHAGRGVGLRGDERPRARHRPPGAQRPARRARFAADALRRRLRRADAADRRPDVPQRLQRRRQLDAVVRPAHALRPAAGADLRRGLAAAVGVLRPLQPGLRAGARRGGRAGREGDDPGLPPVPRAADAAHHASGRAHRPLHAHPVGAAGLLRDAARRRRATRSSTACSAPTSSGFHTERWADLFRDTCRAVVGPRAGRGPGVPARHRSGRAAQARLAARCRERTARARTTPSATAR